MMLNNLKTYLKFTIFAFVAIKCGGDELINIGCLTLELTDTGAIEVKPLDEEHGLRVGHGTLEKSKLSESELQQLTCVTPWPMPFLEDYKRIFSPLRIHNEHTSWDIIFVGPLMMFKPASGGSPTFANAKFKTNPASPNVFHIFLIAPASEKSNFAFLQEFETPVKVSAHGKLRFIVKDPAFLGAVVNNIAFINSADIFGIDLLELVDVTFDLSRKPALDEKQKAFQVLSDTVCTLEGRSYTVDIVDDDPHKGFKVNDCSTSTNLLEVHVDLLNPDTEIYWPDYGINPFINKYRVLDFPKSFIDWLKSLISYTSPKNRQGFMFWSQGITHFPERIDANHIRDLLQRMY